MSDVAVKASPSNLRALIYDIRKMAPSEALSFEKKRMIAMATTDCLRQTGTFYLTPDHYRYFFNATERTLLALNEEMFMRWLADFTGLNPTEIEFRFLTEHLLTEGYQRGQKTRVYHLAHYEQAAHRIFVTDLGAGMWVLDGQSIVHAPNGEGGVLFVTQSSATPFVYVAPDQRPAEATVRAFLNLIHFDSTMTYSQEVQQELLFFWLLSLFFPELHPTKLIPTFIGINGATKTTTARRFGLQLLGERFNVGHLENGERGEQAFIATICGKSFAVFDNADAPIKWLPDRLATFATGQEFELRELYTTNQLAIHRAVAQLMLTSRDPYFRRPDVAERLLICQLARPETFIPESIICAQTLARRNGVWSDLLELVNQTLVALRDVPEAPPLQCRMADFAAFGWRVSCARGGVDAAERFCQNLERLEEQQSRYATEEDPIAACLEIWLSSEQNLGREIETGELYKELNDIAKVQGLVLPKTSAALGKRLHLAKRALELTLGVKIGVTHTSHTSRWAFKVSVSV